ncbi:MAG: type B 50S ribosomal protein L31 [Acidimicrobiales bacterium]
MKSDIHPDYRFVVFQDVSAGTSFLTRSTIAAKETITWDDGNEYPLAKVEISSESHPFFTGQMKIVDTAGRVERFEKRYGRRKQAVAPEPAAAADQDDAPAEETETVTES